jgi:hypothetical protein
MNTIEDTWNYDLLGNISDNYLDSLDMRNINESREITNGIRKRKHNERRPCQYEMEYTYNRYKY